MTTWRIQDLSAPALPQWDGAAARSYAKEERRRRRRLQLVGACLLLADTGALILATVAYGQDARSALLLYALVVLALYSMGAYRIRLSLSALDDMPRLLGGVAIATLALASLATVAGQSQQVPTVVLHSLLIIAVLTLSRALAYAVVRRARAKGLLAYRTVILGTGDVGATLGHALREQPEYGLHLVGFIDGGSLDSKPLPAQALGRATELATLVERHEIDVVLVAFSFARAEELVTPLRAFAASGRQIFVVPRLFKLGVPGPVDRVGATPLVSLPATTADDVPWRAKRILDVELSGLAIVLLSPILLATALAVRIEGGPGVLFRQRRIGLGGHEFTLYKFRSLTPVDESESETKWTVADDDRMGPVGRLIRKTSIDELPQLFNVLRGEMSLVGPRPERPYFVAEFSRSVPSYDERHRVPCGVTGLAAVSGLRGDTSIEERASFDNFYIDNWSLWLDLKIILWTIPAVLKGHDG